MTTTIKLMNGGPIIINNETSNVALCRCGQSDNKLTCDGSHKACQSTMVEAEVLLGEHITIEFPTIVEGLGNDAKLRGKRIR